MISQSTKMTTLLIQEIEVKSENKFIGWANKYKVTIKYQGRSGVFEFTDSINNTNLGKEPLLKDVLGCLVLDFNSKDENFDEFCLNFGYSNDSIKSLNIHKAILKNAEKMDHIFGSHMTLLQKEYENY